MHLRALWPKDQVLQHSHVLTLNVTRVHSRNEVSNAHFVRACSRVTLAQRGQAAA